jgi:hypothetical protein
MYIYVYIHTPTFSSLSYKFSVLVCSGLNLVAAFGGGWMSERREGLCSLSKRMALEQVYVHARYYSYSVYIKRSTTGWLCTFHAWLYQFHYRLSFVCNPSPANSHKLGSGLTIWSYISVINE